jgi:hypothetical protein
MDHLIINGEIIEDYPDDFLYPSALILGYICDAPFHVVAAKGRDLLKIVTVTRQMRRPGSITGRERDR